MNQRSKSSTSKEKVPWWLWPNLLSLDAPLVAVSWLFIIAFGSRNIYVAWESVIALGCIVWMIYVIDRIVDARALTAYRERVHWDKRHEFHYKYRKWFFVMLPIVLSVTIYCLLYGVPKQVFYAGIFPALLCVGYVIVSWKRSKTAPSPERVPYVKNILAGFAFATGTAASAAAWQSLDVIVALFFSPAVLCFALLCILNITAVDLWSDSEESGDENTQEINEVSLTLPLLLLSLFTLYKAITIEDMEQKLFFALFASSACFYVLNRFREHFGVDARRVLADAALLVPIPLFYL